MARRKKEYRYKAWNVTCDLEPYGKWWDWMIEEDDNRAVYWHRTIEEPSYQDVGSYIDEQSWS